MSPTARLTLGVALLACGCDDQTAGKSSSDAAGGSIRDAASLPPPDAHRPAVVADAAPSAPPADPDANSELDVSAVAPDGATADAREPFVKPDGVIPDAAGPDVAIPDFAVQDVALPDLAIPDVALPDLALPDSAIPDLAIPDVAIPDLALPDQALPDAAVPDAAPPPPPDAAPPPPPDAAPPDPDAAPPLCVIDEHEPNDSWQVAVQEPRRLPVEVATQTGLTLLPGDEDYIDFYTYIVNYRLTATVSADPTCGPNAGGRLCAEMLWYTWVQAEDLIDPTPIPIAGPLCGDLSSPLFLNAGAVAGLAGEPWTSIVMHVWRQPGTPDVPISYRVDITRGETPF